MRAIVLAHRQPQPLHILYAVMSADVAFLAELLSVYKVTLDVRTLTSFREWLAPRFCSPSLVQTGKRIAETLIRHIPSDALTTMSLASTLTWTTPAQFAHLLAIAPSDTISLETVLAEALAVDRSDHVTELLQSGAPLTGRVAIRAMCASRRMMFRRASPIQTATLLAASWKGQSMPGLSARLVARAARPLLAQHADPLHRDNAIAAALAALFRLVSASEVEPLIHLLTAEAHRQEMVAGRFTENDTSMPSSLPSPFRMHRFASSHELIATAVRMATTQAADTREPQSDPPSSVTFWYQTPN